MRDLYRLNAAAQDADEGLAQPDPGHDWGLSGSALSGSPDS